MKWKRAAIGVLAVFLLAFLPGSATVTDDLNPIHAMIEDGNPVGCPLLPLIFNDGPDPTGDRETVKAMLEGECQDGDEEACEKLEAITVLEMNVSGCVVPLWNPTVAWAIDVLTVDVERDLNRVIIATEAAALGLAPGVAARAVISDKPDDPEREWKVKGWERGDFDVGMFGFVLPASASDSLVECAEAVSTVCEAIGSTGASATVNADGCTGECDNKVRVEVTTASAPDPGP